MTSVPYMCVQSCVRTCVRRMVGQALRRSLAHTTDLQDVSVAHVSVAHVSVAHVSVPHVRLATKVLPCPIPDTLPRHIRPGRRLHECDGPADIADDIAGQARAGALL